MPSNQASIHTRVYYSNDSLPSEEVGDFLWLSSRVGGDYPSIQRTALPLLKHTGSDLVYLSTHKIKNKDNK